MNERYAGSIIAVHWIMALLLAGLFCVGLYMADLPISPWKLKIYSYHKWAGVTAFLLVLARIVLRLRHGAPDLPATMRPAMQAAAKAAHGLLYVLMVCIPVSGWLMSSAKGFQTVYFGVLPLPDLLSKDKELGDALAKVHQALAFTLAALVAGHALAAVKHQLIDKDALLLRMLPVRSAGRAGRH